MTSSDVLDTCLNVQLVRAADILIAGIGAAPATELGERAGLAMDNGIDCDDHMRTSDPDIYAAGDCCSFPHPVFGGRRLRMEAWRSAQDQAAIATAGCRMITCST